MFVIFFVLLWFLELFKVMKLFLEVGLVYKDIFYKFILIFFCDKFEVGIALNIMDM